MAIYFDCPWCTETISVDNSKVRERVECPYCNRPVKVPAKSTRDPSTLRPPPLRPPPLPSQEMERISERLPRRRTNGDPLRYAGFWSRLGSLLLDFIILLPLVALNLWGSSRFRLFNLYYLIPATVFGLFYHVYLVRRYGGTPGKLIVGIRIRKLNGEPVGYREAFLRYIVDLTLGVLMSVALLFPLFHMSDAEFHSLSFMQRSQRIIHLAPSWYKPLKWIGAAWVWGELIVLLTNRKRRALHDFIAGTVVVHARPLPNTAPEPTGTAPVSSATP